MTVPVFRTSEDIQICRQCRGRCCQGHPGVWVDPDRFLSSFSLPRPGSAAVLKSRLEPLGLELRTINGVPIPAPRSNAAGCTFLDVAGCRLEPPQRPCQCLALEPALDTLLEDTIQCHLPAGASTATALINWRKFWNLT